MRVRLISHSDLGPLVCGYATRVCTSAEMPECPDELAVTMRKGEVSPFKKALDHALASGHESYLKKLVNDGRVRRYGSKPQRYEVVS